MAWNTEQIKELLRDLGPVATIWLLAIIEKNIGVNKAHNYTVFPGKIKSIAKDFDRQPPGDDEISRAFKDLKRRPITTPDGSADVIVIGDKQEYVKLTDHGLTLVTLIDNNPEIEEFIEGFLGEKSVEDTDWFPAPNPDEATVTLRATSEQPSESTDRFEVEAVAEFDCLYPDCEGEIAKDYSFTHPDETWSKKIEAECEECDQAWEFVAGNAHEEPTKPG